jgi:hypothetical protein
LFKKGFEYLKKVGEKYMKANFSEEQQKEYTQLKMSFLLNVSLCHQKLENWSEMFKASSLILKELDP